MKIQSALLAATFLAALSFTPPAQAATIPPNILKLLVELGYLAPLTGVTLTSAQITQIETIEITGWEALLGLNPLNNNLADPNKRSNYGYTSADWLNLVSGVKAGSVTADAENNILSVSQ